MSEIPNEMASSSTFEFAALEWAKNYRAAVLQEFSPYLRGNVLEVGAGIGHLSLEIAALGAVASLTAIEPSAVLTRELRARLAGVTVVEGTIDMVGPQQEVDAIVSVNVLEHIREDRRELAKYAELLRGRSGHLCLFVPARPELYAPIDRDFGHHRRYRKPDLRAKLQGAGFELLRLEYFNWVGYLAWWLTFRVLRRRTFDAGAVKLFDRAIFPLARAFELRVGRPPFGQSLLAVARSRSTTA